MLNNKSKIEITFCVECGFRDVAVNLSNKIESATGLKPVLVDGHAGIMEVTLDQKLVYSNQMDLGVAGNSASIIKRIQEMLSADKKA